MMGIREGTCQDGHQLTHGRAEPLHWIPETDIVLCVNDTGV